MDISAYQNRKFDGLAMRGAKAAGDVLLDLSLFDGNVAGEVCTGVQKLAQRWVMELMTERGSLMFLPDRGTDFLRVVKASGIQSEFDLISEFNTAAVYVYQNLTAEEDDTWHPEDRLQSAELISLSLDQSVIAMHVRITSQAGSARAVILPIPILPIALDRG